MLWKAFVAPCPSPVFSRVKRLPTASPRFPYLSAAARLTAEAIRLRRLSGSLLTIYGSRMLLMEVGR